MERHAASFARTTGVISRQRSQRLITVYWEEVEGSLGNAAL